jgi:hypothetical protein
LKPDVLRAPEIDDRVREIYNSERAAEKAREPVPQPQVPTPSRDASGTITTTPGVDPPVSNPLLAVPMAPAPISSLIPSVIFGNAVTTTRKKRRSLFDNIKLLFPVRNVVAPAPIPPAPSSPLPVYTAPISAPRSGGGGGSRIGISVNLF